MRIADDFFIVVNDSGDGMLELNYGPDVKLRSSGRTMLLLLIIAF